MQLVEYLFNLQRTIQQQNLTHPKKIFAFHDGVQSPALQSLSLYNGHFFGLWGGEKIKKHLSNRQVQNRNILLIRAEASGAVRIHRRRLEMCRDEMTRGFESHVAGSLTHMCAASLDIHHISNKSVSCITLLLEISWSK